MKAGIQWLDRHFEECFLVFFSSIMVGSIALQVFMRFVMGSSLEWSEELARYCFIWLVYMGISYGVKKQRHIKVDVMLLLFKDKAKVALNTLSNVIFLAFALFVVLNGTTIAFYILEWGQTSPAMNLPMGLVYLATPIGMGAASIRLIQQIIKQVQYLSGKNVSKEEVVDDRMVDNYGASDELEGSLQKEGERA
ncbi:TRAP transporter small permease [Shouchella shacheensis]|uniref:TRAP transporter small permease n=1 Tax=Shouchella shacheensis TaxID=1649580 RepID=UPI00073FE8A5|nr:TRAP transporter small permease [Shouchella shacheensis]